MSFAKHLPKMARFGVPRITLACTEKYARRVLKLKKDKPLEWQGIPLNCIGSEKWRKEQAELRRAEERLAKQPQPEGRTDGTR